MSSILPFTSLRHLVLLLAVAAAAVPRPAAAWVAPAEPGVTLQAIASDTRGNVVVAGSRQRLSAASSLYVARYSRDGVLQWWAEEPGGTAGAPAEARAIAVDANGNVYVAGAAAVDAGQPEFFLARYGAVTGARTWRAGVPVPGATGGSAGALSVDGAGRVAAAGYALVNGSPHGVVAQLDGATGAVRWHWTTPAGELRALATDAAGNVAVTGRLLAAKLDADTGAELWRVDRTTTATGTLGFPLMRTVAVDRTGGVVVGGQLRNSLEDYRVFYVARLSGDTGAVEWEYAGSRGSALETATGVQLDRTGDVYAGGRVASLPAALRLLASTGAPGWRQQPWAQDSRPDDSLTVTDLAADARCVFVSGSAGLQRFLAAAYQKSGRLRWRQDLGAGQAVAQSLAAGGRLYLVGALSPGAGQIPQSVVVGLSASTGAQLKGAKRRPAR